MMKWLDIRPRQAPLSPACLTSPREQRPRLGSTDSEIKRFSHRRCRSDTPAVVAQSASRKSSLEEDSPPAEASESASAGCLRRLDVALRRFLMTRSAIYETNKAHFRRLTKQGGEGREFA